MTGSDFGAIGAVWGAMVLLLVVLAPLGIWKAVEIVIWIWNHVHVGIS